MTAADGPVIAEIEGVTAPARFRHLPDALAALWRSLRELPLSELQADAFEYFLTRPNAAEHVRGFLDRDGRLDLTFRLDGRPHSVTVYPATPPARTTVRTPLGR